MESTAITVSPPLVARPTLAARVVATLLDWVETQVHPFVGNGVDQVSLPIVRPRGGRPQFLLLTVDVNGAYTATCDDGAVVEAAQACLRAGVLTEILDDDVQYDVEAEHLFGFATRSADLAPVLWNMARAAERLLERAWTLPPAAVAADGALAAALTASTSARALVMLGDVLWACERHVVVDVFRAWSRLCRLMARPSPELALFTDAIGRQVWTRSRLTRDVGRFGAIRQAVRAALQAFDGSRFGVQGVDGFDRFDAPSLAHWRHADRLIRGYAELEAECLGTQVRAELEVFDDDGTTDIEALVGAAIELGHIGRFALGQGGLR